MLGKFNHEPEPEDDSKPILNDIISEGNILNSSAATVVTSDSKLSDNEKMLKNMPQASLKHKN